MMPYILYVITKPAQVHNTTLRRHSGLFNCFTALFTVNNCEVSPLQLPIALLKAATCLNRAAQLQEGSSIQISETKPHTITNSVSNIVPRR